MEYSIFAAFFAVAVGVIGWVMHRIYTSQGGAFHLVFSLIYFGTFFFGVPFSVLLTWQFDQVFPPLNEATIALIVALLGYGIYFGAYQFRLSSAPQAVVSGAFSADKTAYRTAWILLTIALGALILFIVLNGGLLLFRLEKYSQIFSPWVKGVALKRFFYFFLPALLIFFLIKPSRRAWWWGVIIGGGFGLLSYLAVGGTRANLALALALFVWLGLIYRYFAIKWLLLTACLAVMAMFGLALWRYGLNVKGAAAWQTFLYLTRDTFSPWQNWALILATPLEHQGLMPIIRDFYVYIPQAIWADRPDIVWNSANYFTKTVLGNHSGLAISPTLLGSFYIMGGYPLICVGMAMVGRIIRWLDRGLASASVLRKSYCLANLFNVIVLVREGFDGFVSRWVFFTLIFLLAYVVAKGIGQIKEGKNG